MEYTAVAASGEIHRARSGGAGTSSSSRTVGRAKSRGGRRSTARTRCDGDDGPNPCCGVGDGPRPTTGSGCSRRSHDELDGDLIPDPQIQTACSFSSENRAGPRPETDTRTSMTPGVLLDAHGVHDASRREANSQLSSCRPRPCRRPPAAGEPLMTSASRRAA